MRPELRELLKALVALPGPPGQEDAVRQFLCGYLDQRGIAWRVDAKGNLLVGAEKPKTVITAHLDEIALQVAGTVSDGALAVTPLGGAHPWKWGEGPVELLPRGGGEPIPGVLAFGSIHTTHPTSAIQRAREGNSLTWADALVLTGSDRPILPGTRVVLARSRRTLWPFGNLLASYFLDDRADLVVWLLVLEALRERDDLLFAATVSEELGGHGALWLMHHTLPERCIALEIGPVSADSAVALTATPTCWVSDGFAPTDPRDLILVERAAQRAGTGVQFQVLTRGGSDASCAAAQGLCARPLTLAFPCENTHGFEVMHPDALDQLAALTIAVV